MLRSLADLTVSRPRRMALVALGVFLVGAFLGAPAPGKLDAQRAFDDPGSASAQAREQITRATGRAADPEVLALVRARPASRQVAPVARVLRADPGVAQVASVVGATAVRPSCRRHCGPERTRTRWSIA